MRLHDYAASANCLKVRLILAMLDRPYERVPVDIFAGDTLTEAFARLNPLRETPVLELDDGRTLAQSNAIVTFLAQDTAFLPDDAFERALVAQWLAFEQERVMSGIGGASFRRLTGRAALDPGAIRSRVRAGPRSARRARPPSVSAWLDRVQRAVGLRRMTSSPTRRTRGWAPAGRSTTPSRRDAGSGLGGGAAVRPGLRALRPVEPGRDPVLLGLGCLRRVALAAVCPPRRAQELVLAAEAAVR
jgi:hypothetical protein